MRAMIVENGVVINVAIFETEADMFEGYIVAPDGVGPNFTDNGDGTFTAPPREPEQD